MNQIAGEEIESSTRLNNTRTTDKAYYLCISTKKFTHKNIVYFKHGYVRVWNNRQVTINTWTGRTIGLTAHSIIYRITV